MLPKIQEVLKKTKKKFIKIIVIGGFFFFFLKGLIWIGVSILAWMSFSF